MNSPHITYVPSGGDANPQTELSALANIYRFVLERKEAAPRQSRPDDPERRSDDIRATTRIP
jgi:hypothetical protein